MTALEDYQGRVDAVLVEAEQHLTSTQIADPWRLAQHGEPAEGLAMLAWSISEAQVRVPRHLIDAIRALTEGMVEPGDLPADLDDWALASDPSTSDRNR